MKIAVYAIARNEEAHVERWAASCADADVRVLLDTGSTDRTVELARAAGVTVYEQTFSRWRFDDARNAALACVPEDVDYCVTLDLDELLLPGWRDALEALPLGTTRPRYLYVWSRNADGSEGLTYAGHSAHARHGYEWRGAVHEAVTHVGPGDEIDGWCEMVVEHHPDPMKSRGQYLDLLAEAAAEEPGSARYAFYYARELMYRGRPAEAVAEFDRYLTLPGWSVERSCAMRHIAAHDETRREAFLLRACAEAPERREPWVDLALHRYREHSWEECLAAATRALQIAERPLAYFCEPYAWGPIPHDLAALSCHYLGLPERATAHGEDALAIDPGDPRLSENLNHYRDGVSA